MSDERLARDLMDAAIAEGLDVLQEDAIATGPSPPSISLPFQLQNLAKKQVDSHLGYGGPTSRLIFSRKPCDGLLCGLGDLDFPH